MSDALTPDAPETDPAVTSVEDSAPGDETAVAVGSAGEGDSEWKRRFDGLMASSQRREADLQRRLEEALEARITSQGDTTEVADEAILAKLDALEERARKAERKAALADVLSRYPDAKPFADLIVGDNAEDIENVAAAIAQRAATLTGRTTEPDPAATGDEPAAAATGDEPAAATEPSTEAPVIGGGNAAPAEPSTTDALRSALAEGSWDAYWKAKSGPAATANLG